MVAPLRKVIDRSLRHVAMSMSQRGRHVTVVNHYHSVFTLECGHCVEVASSARDVAHKRCKKCEVR